MKQTKKSAKQKVLKIFLAALCALAFVFGFTAVNSSGANAEVAGSNVINLTPNGGNVFDSNAGYKLYESLTGTTGATLENVKDLVKGTQRYGADDTDPTKGVDIPTIVTAEDIRGTNKSDLTVTFGKYNWTVTSLTRSKSDDPILTLFLAPEQALDHKLSIFAGSDSANYIDPTKYGWYDADVNSTYISNVYGTSFVRNVTLSAGGYWATSKSTLSSNKAGQNDKNDFAQYTMADVEGSLISYITTPSQIKYQEIENVLVNLPGWTTDYDLALNGEYTLKNEAYGTPEQANWFNADHDMDTKYIGNDTINPTTNQTKESEYTGWKNDYIWLPSITETGAEDLYLYGKGIWALSKDQRSNTCEFGAWLRSGHNQVFVRSCLLSLSGNSYDNGTSLERGVRPALHLNLSKVNDALCKHELTKVEGKAADCINDGTQEHWNCEKCGAKFQDEEGTKFATDEWLKIPARHKIEEVARVAPTCKAEGKEAHYKCTVCDKLFSDSAGTSEITDESALAIPLAAHTITEVERVDSTCSEEGKEAHYKCTVCDKLFSDSSGTTQITDESTLIIVKKPHTEVDDEAVAPTCTETGLTAGKHCSVCNTVTVEQKTVSALGHKEVTDPAVAATCTTTGKSEGKRCSVCGVVTVEQKTIPAKGHTLSPWQHDKNSHWKLCSTCNQKVDDAGHNWSDWEITKQPTTEETGEKKCSCPVCSEMMVEKIAKLVSDEGGNGSVSDLPILDDPNSSYELEITVEATNTVYTLEGINKGYKVNLWIVGGENKVAYDKERELTLSLIVPAEMEEFTLYKLIDGGFKPIESSAYTVANGVLSIRTTLPEEFIFNEPTAATGLPWWVWLVIVLGVLLIATIIIIIVVKTRKKSETVVVQGADYDDAALKAQLAEQNKRLEDLEDRDDGGFNDPYDGELE